MSAKQIILRTIDLLGIVKPHSPDPFSQEYAENFLGTVSDIDFKDAVTKASESRLYRYSQNEIDEAWKEIYEALNN